MRRPAHAAIGLLVLVLAGCAAVGTSAPSTPTATEPDPFADVPFVPDDGVHLGVYAGESTIEEVADGIGVMPAIRLTYFGWEDPWATDATLAEDRAAGRISLVNWEPFGVEFDDIVDGRFDDMLVERAQQAAELPEPVMVDLAAEMNEEEGWGSHDPELYVAAYRHVHDVFAEHDGGNVTWVWAPNNVDSADAPPALDYYPGPEYVDWVGIDGYNWGTSDPDFTWQSFEEVFGPMYDDLATLGHPIIVGETASAEEGGSKPDWIADVVPTLEERFPDIRALVWFDVDKERDWRIRSSNAAADAFAALAADPLFDTR